MKKTLWKKIGITLMCVVLGVVLIVAGYLSYVLISYNRIEDNQPVQPEGTAAAEFLQPDTEYTAITYNIGFGAYTPDFTFFMDGGTQSWAASKESVIDCIHGDIALLKQYQSDISLIQEVDFDATRSYHVDEATMLREAFPDSASTLAVNYHSPFLFYPLLQPHGASNAGLMTFSKARINSAVRRSLPISESLSKLVDLDRCYFVNRIPVENGKELVVFNAHLSAYGTDGDLQAQQMQKLFGDMQQEYEKGNYVICGGDFNHDFLGNSKELFNAEVPEQYTWAAPFPDHLIPAGFRKITNYQSGVTIPSCRNCDKPYGPDCFTLIVDGFIASDNVESTFMDVIDNQFLFSDHNPVELKFKLLSD
ncbi:MAG: endonuclease/exonuclease/phosphatase family protein [Clostridia bacterium]|nr:endonuclease/exonuclease/phosphatase family protein [Clostridia bacterium]